MQQKNNKISNQYFKKKSLILIAIFVEQKIFKIISYLKKRVTDIPLSLIPKINT
jgi:hypothetical protein